MSGLGAFLLLLLGAICFILAGYMIKDKGPEFLIVVYLILGLIMLLVSMGVSIRPIEKRDKFMRTENRIWIEGKYRKVELEEAAKNE